MRRLPILLVSLAMPPLLAGQSSQFGVRGLGLPGRQQSARAMGSAGAFAFFDGESSVSPASIGYIGQLTATFTALGDYRSTSTPSGEASIRNPRFPQFLVGGPIRRFPMTLALSYSNYSTRDYSLSFPATIILRDQPVNVTDTIESRGGINDFRLAAAYRLAAVDYHDIALAERFVDGPEYTASILGEAALPLIRIDAPQGNYDYEHKYFSDDTKYLCPCGLPRDKEAALQSLCLEAFRLLGCSGWGRVDLMLDKRGRAYLLEVNTAPGMTDHSLVPMAARAVGLSYEDLCVRILEGAHVG